MSNPTEEEELRGWLDNETRYLRVNELKRVEHYMDRAEIWGLTEPLLRLTRELCEEGYSLLDSLDTACLYWDI
jgi:hypothetical protein